VLYEVAWVDNGSPGAVAVAARLGVAAALTPTGKKPAHDLARRARRAEQDAQAGEHSRPEPGLRAPMADHVWLAEENLGLAWGAC